MQCNNVVPEIPFSEATYQAKSLGLGLVCQMDNKLLGNKTHFAEHEMDKIIKGPMTDRDAKVQYLTSIEAKTIGIRLRNQSTLLALLKLWLTSNAPKEKQKKVRPKVDSATRPREDTGGIAPYVSRVAVGTFGGLISIWNENVIREGLLGICVKLRHNCMKRDLGLIIDAWQEKEKENGYKKTIERLMNSNNLYAT
ncbi:hypothetical protein CR513_39268, partial [Mucuna pruriens]